MVTDIGHDDSDLEPVDSQRLGDDLRALYAADCDVPQQVNQAVIGLARRHFAGYRRRRLLLRAVGIPAAAASILLVVWFARTWERSEDAAVPVHTASHEDIDRNGRVDIRDAFMLARQIETGESPKQRWDINGDGKVDRADVDTIAMAAVKLDGGTIQ